MTASNYGAIIRQPDRHGTNKLTRLEENKILDAIIEKAVSILGEKLLDKFIEKPGTFIKYALMLSAGGGGLVPFMLMWVLKKGNIIDIERQVNKLGNLISPKDAKTVLDAARSAHAKVKNGELSKDDVNSVAQAAEKLQGASSKAAKTKAENKMKSDEKLLREYVRLSLDTRRPLNEIFDSIIRTLKKPSTYVKLLAGGLLGDYGIIALMAAKALLLVGFDWENELDGLVGMSDDDKKKVKKSVGEIIKNKKEGKSNEKYDEILRKGNEQIKAAAAKTENFDNE